MWDLIIYALIVVNIVVLILLLTREVKRSRESANSLALAAQRPMALSASGGSSQQVEHLAFFPPLISDIYSETSFTTQRPLPTAGSLLFSVLFLAVGIAILSWGIRLTDQGLTSRSWPAVTGKIISSTAIESKDANNRPIYHAEVRYTYAVDNVAYTNDQVSFVYASSSDQSSSKRIAARYPAGKITYISYDPAQPKNAVLEPGLNTSFLLLYGIGGVFIITSLLFIYLAGKRRFTARPRF